MIFSENKKNPIFTAEFELTAGSFFFENKQELVSAQALEFWWTSTKPLHIEKFIVPIDLLDFMELKIFINTEL